ncbi:hypothetical protein ACQP00_41495 [Dactylosporangium sp. CS-047395]|uniref:hypothetical protein n=1 Tax=Dactylosporangium sp. CS-047395 TaxID=3239936 RepID=UPI003D8C9AD0
MFAGDDENQQLTSGPRHLRGRRFAHAAPFSASTLKALTERPTPARNFLLSAVPPLPQRTLRGAAALALAVLALTTTLTAHPAPKGDVVAVAPAPERSAPQVASRGEQRTAPPSAAPTPAQTFPTVADPVGGLSRAEMDNAIAIVDVAKRERLPKRAVIVALATALQESHLRNLANGNLPASLDHPNQGVGYDYDSVGLFQQRPNWGSIDQLMDPHESARRFYAALTRIPGWGDYAVTVAAQKVQGSAFPDAYAKWEGLATQIADATMQG